MHHGGMGGVKKIELNFSGAGLSIFGLAGQGLFCLAMRLPFEPRSDTLNDLLHD
jgi:hypothetical protein